MKVSIDAADREFLERLRKLDEPTIHGICQEFGVTATAVRHRLGRLQEMGLVGRETSRTGRGRPHHIYRVSEAGLRGLGENYADLAVILWRAISQIEEPELRSTMINRVEDAFVRRYGRGVSGASLGERIESLRLSLISRGYDVEVDLSQDVAVLREKNCPYLELASEDKGICELEQAVFQRVLGSEVRLTQCCLDGHSCCEFQADVTDRGMATTLR